MDSSNQSSVAPNGAAWAAILAAGIGCCAYGLFIDLAEGSKLCSRLMDFYDPVGNLSGKTALGILIWLIAWAGLHWRWKNRSLGSTQTITVVTLALVALGIIASCPLFFELFAVR